MDIVEYFQTEVEKLNWVFSYGNKANQNLIASDKNIDTIYFLLDPIETTEESSEYGGDGEITYTGQFLLLVKSNLDNVYHNQKNNNKDNGKYNKNILPLKTELKKFKDVVDCSIYTRDSWKILEATNILDVNMDGLIVTYTLKEN